MSLAPTFPIIQSQISKEFYSNTNEAILRFCSNCKHLNELSNFLSFDRAIVKKNKKNKQKDFLSEFQVKSFLPKLEIILIF